MKVAVIGANSFSGFSFIKYINKKFKNKNLKIFCFSRSKQKDTSLTGLKFDKKKNIFIKADINKKTDVNKIISIIKKEKVIYILNFAAQSMVGESWLSPLDWYKTNVMSTINLIEQINKIDIKKYIHFTTPEVYGDIRGNKKENFEFYPSTPYAISRATTDMHLHALNRFSKFPVIFTRASNVYGNGQDFYRLIPKLFYLAKLKKEFPLHGGGESIRNFIHIDDVSAALIKILKKGKIGETYHISGRNYHSIREIARKVYSMYNLSSHKFIKKTKDRLAKDKHYKLDSSKLRKELNWSDKISLDEGIQKFLNWFESTNINKKAIYLRYNHKK